MKLQIAIAGLLAAALPAAAQPPPQPTPAWTPWSVESPGPLGARFGLGVDLLLDGVDEAEVVAGLQTVRLIGEDGSPRTDVVPLDPGLVNRKHGQDWEERSFGFQVPVALPPFRLPGALQVEPSLVFEAAAVDGRLTFVDLVEDAPDRTLDGTGARWGIGVEALGELCRGCRWFWSAGYRYRSLGGLEVDGPAPADAAGLAVTERTEIDHDAHHITARLGTLVAGGRATVYLGVRRRQSDLVIEDETTLRFPQARPETVVATRLDLEADDTAALAGTDFRLGRGYVGRVEATFGGNGESVLLKLVRVHHWVKPRAITLAEQIKPQVAELGDHIERQVRQMEEAAGPDGAFPVAQSLALLDEIERELRRILSAPELQPTLAWFLIVIDRARGELRTGEQDGRPAPWSAPISLRFAAISPQPSQQPNAQAPASDRSWWAWFREHLEKLETRDLTIGLCVRSRPASTLGSRAQIQLKAPWERSNPLNYEAEQWVSTLYRGAYAYTAILEGFPPASCRPDMRSTCLLDLWIDDGPTLICDFERFRPICRPDPADAGSCRGRR